MARIFSEGFENGLPTAHYREGYPACQFFDGLYFSLGTTSGKLPIIVTGRGSYSQGALRIYALNSSSNIQYIIKQFNNLSEVYIRFYLRFGAIENTTDRVQIRNSAGTTVLAIAPKTTTSLAIKMLGTEKAVYTAASGTWYKIDMYLKVSSTVGAWEIKIDNVSIASEMDVDTNDYAISSLLIGYLGSSLSDTYYLDIDDLAANDTTGTRNNSWCGDGAIISLKPKGTGNKTQWTTCQGYAVAENGTTTTNIEITGHGLTTGDVIYNVSRDAYRQVTVVDANNLTVSSVTSQAENDIIVAFTYSATIAAITGTSTAQVVIPAHTLETYDVFVNTTRSNAIRRVLYTVGTICINNDSDNTEYPGSSVTSQTTGDSIATYKIKYFTLTNHWQAVSNALPNPAYSNIQSSTIDQIDTFDMEELVADKGLPTNTKIICATVKAYMREKGAGSQYQPVLRIDSADYVGTTVSLVGGTLEYSSLFENSPDTETQFTLSEIDSIECGVKVV